MLYLYDSDAVLLQYFRRDFHGGYFLCGAASDYRQGEGEKDQHSDVYLGGLIYSKVSLLVRRKIALRKNNVLKLIAYCCQNQPHYLHKIREEMFHNMKRRYAKFLLLLAAASVLLVGCSNQPAEDQGELIQRQTEQLEMYI